MKETLYRDFFQLFFRFFPIFFSVYKFPIKFFFDDTVNFFTNFIIFIKNVDTTALRWFASDTAHIVFIHILSVVKPVHIFMARSRICKSCLTVELYFHRSVHFDCVAIYIFCFHHKQFASD